MSKFTITFKNGIGEIKNLIIDLNFSTVQGAQNWFEDTFGLRAKSISKH